LSVAAHLLSAGIETRVFGEPMESWQRHMPKGMVLRSLKPGSNIADPNMRMRLDDYAASKGIEIPEPVPLMDFTEYGLWFQRQIVPGLDRRMISRLEAGWNGFRLTSENAETLVATCVVVAAGIRPFAYRPSQFTCLPPALVSHSSEHSDFESFAGARVVVIGGGQSALESAALLAESGAEVEILLRAPAIHWLEACNTARRTHGFRALLCHRSQVGLLLRNWLVARPDLLRMLPVAAQRYIDRCAIRPNAADWLRPRLANVRITGPRFVASVSVARGGMRLTLDDGNIRQADHVLLCTGYAVDISRYHFIAPELLGSITRVDGYPRLRSGFECSVPGLFFVGAPAAYSFGALMRFVCGTEYCAKTIAEHIVSGSDTHA
jgi:cation diffusion facilitator CzcD-associated flavoprotein CzcO